MALGERGLAVGRRALQLGVSTRCPGPSNCKYRIGRLTKLEIRI